jgi:dynein heavy chain
MLCGAKDWFTEWPSDALESVASRFLQDVNMPDETRESCVRICISIHESVSSLSKQFLLETKYAELYF